MQPNLSLSGINMSDLSLLYVLVAVLILLALIAAIGAWVRGGGLKREDAESLFADVQERHREEISRLEALLRETREANEAAQKMVVAAQDRSCEMLTSRLEEVDKQVQQSRSGVEAAVAQATADYTEALSDELEMVARKLSETDRRVGSGISELNESLARVQKQVGQAGDQIRQALIEITKQQQDQKAQSTIQMCEALISSLGALKSSIANQLEHSMESSRTVDGEIAEDPAVEQTAVGELRMAQDDEPEAPAEDAREDVGFSTPQSADADADMDRTDDPLNLAEAAVAGDSEADTANLDKAEVENPAENGSPDHPEDPEKRWTTY